MLESLGYYDRNLVSSAFLSIHKTISIKAHQSKLHSKLPIFEMSRLLSTNCSIITACTQASHVLLVTFGPGVVWCFWNV